MMGRVVLGATLAIGAAFGVDCAVAATETNEKELDSVVVQAGRYSGLSTTAALHPAPLFEIPVSVSVIRANELAERAPKDIADLADYAPGVSRRSNYWGVNTPSFQLRGFNAGDASAYYKDGFRYQARGPQSMANVESIEILRGPQSALYGWSEPGGAVQIRVKQPTTQNIRQISLYADAWGKIGSTLDTGGKIGESHRFRFIAAHERGGSFRDRQDSEQILIAPSLAWDFSGGKTLLLSLEWLDDRRTTDYGIPAINGRPADVPVSRIYTESWGRQHSRASRLSAKWTQPLWDGDLTFALANYRLKYLKYHDVEPYSVTGTTINRWYESYPEQYNWLTTYVDWTRTLQLGAWKHQIGTRIEGAQESRSLYGGILDEYPSINAFTPIYGQAWTPTADYSVYDQAWRNRNFGIALQDQVTHGNWTILLGLRAGYLRQKFDYVDYLPTPGETHTRQSDITITPRLGLSWRVQPAISLYANYSAGAMPTLPQSRAFDGSAFSPVTGKQWEAGAKFQPSSESWLGSIAIFEIERSNALTRDPAHPSYSIQTGEQRSRGIELEWSGKLAPGWHLTAQGTWLDAEIVKDNRYRPGNRLPYSSKFSASAWIRHNFRTSDTASWVIAGGIVHQGERYADFANTVRIPSFTRLDAGITYRAQRWSTTFSIENLADKRYYASGVENRPAVIYPGAPRTLNLRMNFDLN